MKERVIRFLLTYALFVAIFVLQRPIFIAYYHDLYAGIGFIDVLSVVWHGLPLDCSLAGYLAAIPGLLSIVSVWTAAHSLRIARIIYFAIAALIMSATFIVDLALYGFWGFRLDATPVFYFFTSPADAMASVGAGFIMLGIFFTILYAAVIWFLLTLVERVPLRMPRKRIKTTATMTLLTAALFIPIRGSFTTSTMNLSVAYFSANQRLNHAAINPLFSFMYSALHQTDFDKQYRYMPPEKADRLFAELIERPAANDTVPQLFTTERPNVIMIILESFSVHLMPSFGGENIAPNLDRFGKEGILFTNFYSNSFRTDRALTSIISGYPAQPSTSIMKFTEKIERLPSLSKTMKNAGYDIAYYYGGDANFTNMRAYLVSAGFERIVCDKDFPLSERTGKWGAHDHLVFEKLLADLRTEKTNRPILRILQTSSSHEPFDVPFHKFNDKAANAFAYTDQCLGSFVEELRRSPMWKNTVVVLVPDHQGCYPPNLDNPVERHHIPLVIIGGAVKKPLRIDTYASQIDIAATLLCQLGLPHDDFTFSKNILNPASPHFGYFTEPSLFGMITDKNALVFNCDANAIVIDEGKQKSANLEYGKAFLQKLYDDLAKR